MCNVKISVLSGLSTLSGPPIVYFFDSASLRLANGTGPRMWWRIGDRRRRHTKPPKPPERSTVNKTFRPGCLRGGRRNRTTTTTRTYSSILPVFHIESPKRAEAPRANLGRQSQTCPSSGHSFLYPKVPRRPGFGLGSGYTGRSQGHPSISLPRVEVLSVT